MIDRWASGQPGGHPDYGRVLSEGPDAHGRLLICWTCRGVALWPSSEVRLHATAEVAHIASLMAPLPDVRLLEAP